MLGPPTSQTREDKEPPACPVPAKGHRSRPPQEVFPHGCPQGPGRYRTEVKAWVKLTLQWHSPLVLLQSGSKPLLTSQLHGPHVGCPHQPRGQGWSILQRGTQAGMSSLCHPCRVWPCVALPTLAATQPGSQCSEGQTRDEQLSPRPAARGWPTYLVSQYGPR